MKVGDREAAGAKLQKTKSHERKQRTVTDSDNVKATTKTSKVNTIKNIRNTRNISPNTKAVKKTKRI